MHSVQWLLPISIGFTEIDNVLGVEIDNVLGIWLLSVFPYWKCYCLYRRTGVEVHVSTRHGDLVNSLPRVLLLNNVGRRRKHLNRKLSTKEQERIKDNF